MTEKVVATYTQRRQAEAKVEAEMTHLGHVLPRANVQGQNLPVWNRPDRYGKPRNHIIRCSLCQKAGVVEVNGNIRGDALQGQCPGKAND